VASRIGQRLIHGYHLPGSAPRPGEGGVSNRGRHSDTRRAAPSLHIYSSEEYSSIHHTRRTHMRTHIASWRFLGPLAPRYCVKLYRVVRSRTHLSVSRRLLLLSFELLGRRVQHATGLLRRGPAWVRVPMSKTRGLRPRPAGSLEALFSARSCPRLTRASASLGRSAAWAALPSIGRVFDIGEYCGVAKLSSWPSGSSKWKNRSPG